MLCGESWLDKGTETVPAATGISYLVYSLSKVEVDKEILLLDEALKKEGVNTKVKEKSNQDLNQKLWKSGGSCDVPQKEHRARSNEEPIKEIIYPFPRHIHESNLSSPSSTQSQDVALISL
ncbi:hypothetical protein WISP_36887 [Willisornis vidua]|uniref:Uncharacterized protein n=1 Tax=Willisornis vidua TaxID=1566151 RepID=A0ABQ9DNF6_9PASS|nr:hypothetical protein WISP_36887 [Willisornis vidua]